MKFAKKGRWIVAVLLGLVTIIGLADIVFLIPQQNPAAPPQEEVSNGMETLSLVTADGVRLTADFFSVESPRGWILYLHMMRATKESFVPLAQLLALSGYAGLAVDLRGHGQSQGGPQGYESFSELEHQTSRQDVDAALVFLETQGASKDHIVIVGASIGANLALDALARDRSLAAAVLLSPGLDYHGLITKSAVTRLAAPQRVFFASSQDDGYNTQEVEELFGLVPSGVGKDKVVFTRAGHGTTMLEKEPSLADAIVRFIVQ
jgi:dienelactone hydrolase